MDNNCDCIVGKKITQFTPISDADLQDTSLLWVVGDVYGTLYKPNIQQMKTLLANGTSLYGDLQTVLNAGTLLTKDNFIYTNTHKFVYDTTGGGASFNSVMMVDRNYPTNYLNESTLGMQVGYDNKAGILNYAELMAGKSTFSATDATSSRTLTIQLTTAGVGLQYVINSKTYFQVDNNGTTSILGALNTSNGVGAINQILASTITGVQWVDPASVTPPPTPQGLESVLQTNPNISQSYTIGIGQSVLVFNGAIGVFGVIRDSTQTGGTAGQVLSSTGTATKWINPPTSTLQLVTGAGNTTTLKINALNYDATANDLMTQNGNRLLAYNTTSRAYTFSNSGMSNAATGTDDIAIGDNALKLITTGASNIGIGNGALGAATTISGSVAIGINALKLSNGANNTALGYNSLSSIVSGVNSTAFGYGTLALATSNYNDAFGYNALNALTTGTQNSAFGNSAQVANLTGNYNTGIGQHALHYNTAGSNNTAVGYWALLQNLASDNVGMGVSAMQLNSTGTLNVGIGRYNSQSNDVGSNNTSVGAYANYANKGNSNVFIGSYAGSNSTAVNSSIVIGASAQLPANTGNNQMNIGNILYSADGTKLGIFRTNPTATVDINGTLKVGAYTLPVTDGSVNQVLQTNGAGVLGWGTLAGVYSLPIASPTILGGIKIGANLSIDGSGVLSANPPAYVLPIASASILGGVKIGSGLIIDASGLLSNTVGAYNLPLATTTILGGVKVGSGLSVDGSGVLSNSGIIFESDPVALAKTITINGNSQALSANPNFTIPSYTLPIASPTILGGIKVGSNLSIAGDGTLSSVSSYVLPIASPSVLGGIKIGANLTIDGSGVLSGPSSGTVTLGVTLDGGGSQLTTGQKGYIRVPYNATITGWAIISREIGSVTFDVWKLNGAKPTVANTITASAKPTLSSTDVATSTALTGWTTSIQAGDIIGWNLDSVATSTWVILELTITKN